MPQLLMLQVRRRPTTLEGHKSIALDPVPFHMTTCQLMKKNARPDFALAAYLGLPRASSKDDRFGDYFFPKATILQCCYSTPGPSAATRNTTRIPTTLIPYGLRASRSPSVTETEWQTCGCRSSYRSGFGRRICPGKQFAFSAMLLAASKIIWPFEVLPPEEGVHVSIETGYNTANVKGLSILL